MQKVNIYALLIMSILVGCKGDESTTAGVTKKELPPPEEIVRNFGKSIEDKTIDESNGQIVSRTKKGSQSPPSNTNNTKIAFSLLALGVQGTLIVEDSLKQQLIIKQNGTHTFSQKVAKGSAISLKVQ